MIGSIIIGVLSSFVASCVFLCVLFRLRPKIEVSPYIALTADSEDEKEYMLKIINRAKRDVINIKCELALRKYINVPDGRLEYDQVLPLSIDSQFRIGSFNKKDKMASYAHRFACDEDIDGLWDDKTDNHLIFTVVAQDSLTGFYRVFTKSFHTKRQCLREGYHRFGNSLEVE